MKIERSDDRLLFLRYALPCAGTLVQRGNVTREYIDGLVEKVGHNVAPKENAEAMFKVANVMCDRVAEKMGKQSTDSEVIRRYFLFEHAKVVDDRFELMKDFSPIDCRTYSGSVIDADRGSAMVETILGRRDYKTPFVADLKKGDKVVVHFDYIVERISEELAREKRALDEKEKVS